jgi:CheY-like chemotaxis protein
MNKPSVLLLERSSNVISMIRAALADTAELHVANTVELALRIAERREITVAVLDATMAGLSSGDTVGRLRTVRPAVRIVFLTEPPFDADPRLARSGHVLRKPITPERISVAVRNAMRLQSMTAGVERMRTSSGTFTAVRPPEIAAAPAPAQAPPQPPAAEARVPLESGEIPVGEAAREPADGDGHDKPEAARPRGEVPRKPTPPPFLRVRDR